MRWLLGVLLMVTSLADAQVVREDWPAVDTLVAVAMDPCPADEPTCSIATGWSQPFIAPPAPVNVQATATGCTSVHVTYEVDWPIPYLTTTRVYVDGGLLVGEHEDGTDLLEQFDAAGVTRGVTEWQLDAYSTTYGTEYASAPTAPVAVDTRQVCPLQCDCRTPMDDAFDLFDVLFAIDVVLGHASASHGSCDCDCDSDADLFDVVRLIDVVQGAVAPPASPCLGDVT